jgi:hypothetical protein
LVQDKKAWEINMIAKVLSGAVISGLLLAVSAPVTFAEDAAPPKTKAECKKAKGTWDAMKKECVLPK